MNQNLGEALLPLFPQLARDRGPISFGEGTAEGRALQEGIEFILREDGRESRILYPWALVSAAILSWRE